MRVLLASDHYPPFIGGAHRWAELLAHGLARRGHDVTVATEWHGGLPREERSGAVGVHRVRQLRTAMPLLVRDPRQRHSPPFPDPVTVRDLRRVVSAAKPEVAIAHGWLASSVAVALRRMEIPLLLSAHDYGYFCATRTLLHEGRPCSGPAPSKCLECATGFYGGAGKGVATVGGVALSRSLLARKIDGLQCVSSFVEEVTWRHVFGGSGARRQVRRFTIPAFLDADPPRSAGERERVQSVVAKLPAAPFILFVGALRTIKGVHVLLEAYARLSDPPPLVLMGTFHEDTPTHFPPGAVALADAPHAAVMEAWDRALLGVVPSVWPEPLGTVAIEAASRGKPVIATVPSGMADVLGDTAGILIEQGNAAALAEAMRALIEAPALRARLGRAGRARSARFEAEVVLTQYERALGELVAGRAGAAPN